MAGGIAPSAAAAAAPPATRRDPATPAREPAAPADAGALEAVLGVRFADPALLRMALTHRSFRNENEGPGGEDNERLEFLGDALVDFVAADYLFRRLPDAREGELTALRAALVCEPALAAFARAIDLGAYLRLGRGEAATGGRDRPTTLSNTFEALIGAVFLDQGFQAAERVVMAFLEPELAAIRAGKGHKDAKSRFQEYAQRRWRVTPCYATVETTGPDHAKEFVVAVYVGPTAWGHGRGRSKSVAAQYAAQEALDRAEAEAEVESANDGEGPPAAGGAR